VCRRDAKSVKVKKGDGVVKFKIRCSKVRDFRVAWSRFGEIDGLFGAMEA
jgi:hypothetical protein